MALAVVLPLKHASSHAETGGRAWEWDRGTYVGTIHPAITKYST